MLHIAHPGIRRMVQLARKYFYWPAMHDDIERFVKDCYHCNQTAASPPKEPLHPWPDTKKSWTRIHIDFAGPIKKEWILIIVDSYSKFVDAACFSTITTAATCRYLRRLFCRYGPPEVLVSDNGTQFTSEDFAQLCSEFNILHLRSPPGHPQSNGQAERMVGTLKRSIDLSSPIENELSRFLYTYNYTPCDAAPDQKSPAEIFFGRAFRTPLDFSFPRSSTQPTTALTCRQEEMKRQFDTHHGARPRLFVTGQPVFIKLSNGKRIPGRIDKLIGSAIARVTTEGGFLIRHFNQIWNRMSSFLPRIQEPMNEVYLPSMGQSITSQADFMATDNTSVPAMTMDDASVSTPSTKIDSTTFSTTLDNVSVPTSSSATVSCEQLPPSEKIVRRSERLLHHPRFNYKEGIRRYR
ncbi:PREDICTED: uncharacterized protein K02A2.6-like [Vollenhovia emeryi]|uniref:uncharacterized protein K02A2.6-like n=1 Tax=Vollenhovia emeryi TaxID=411798 RepID=UPI0005F55807|nr:PREDICTED: uncharacterized protein K02A2.6-like [Vollenhovia emeryi]